MQIKISDDNGKIVITLDGRLDVSSYFDFKQQVGEVLSRSTARIIIDCEKLTMISSVGIRELVVLKQKLDEKKETLELFRLNDKLRDIFKTAGLEKIFTFTK